MEEQEILQGSLIEIAKEYVRFSGVCRKMMSSLTIEEQEKYAGQMAWFQRKIETALQKAQLRLLNMEGQIYDPGMPVIPLNLDDFEENDSLIITRMVEPVIMCGDQLRQEGTVLLGREAG